MKHFLFYLTVTSTLIFSGCKKGAADAKSGPKAVEKIQPLTYLYDVNNGEGEKLIGILGRHDELQDNEQFHEKITDYMIISEEKAIFPNEEIFRMEVCSYAIFREDESNGIDIDAYWELAKQKDPTCEKITEKKYVLIEDLGKIGETSLNTNKTFLIQFLKDSLDNNEILDKDREKIETSWKIVFQIEKGRYDDKLQISFTEIRHPEAGILARVLNYYQK